MIIFLFFLIFFLPIILFLFLFPLGYLFYGLLNILTIPLQIIEIAINKNLRKNHALEHATINVIEEEMNKRGILSGYARENGFYVFGRIDPEILLKASEIGREKLILGETHYAIHERCGTSIGVASFLTIIFFLLLIILTSSFNIFLLLIAIILGQILGPPLGKLTQKYFTTDPDVSDIKIVSVEYNPTNIYGPFGILYPSMPSSFFIRTERIKTFRVL
ncbi:MAG: DUF6391 domain-containing protein [Caldisericia bacterium]|jgi:predicted membrane protein|nr:DUF6391 domain-containing protein [Caldisericia bacterium]